MPIRHFAAITSFVVLLSSQAFGQARVVEAGGGNAPSQSAPNNELVVSLYNQLEALQQEVQSLRGLVEEQGNQIRRMQTEQRDRYLDIDRRLSEMPAAPLGATAPGVPNAGGTATLPNGAPNALPPVNQGAANPVAATTPAPTASTPTVTPSAPATLPPANVATTSVSPTGVVNTQPQPQTSPVATTNNSSTLIGAASQSPQDEQALYREALRLLLDEDKYIESIQMLQTYIDTYPNGRLLTNAIYWQGEAYLAIAEFNQAEAMFNRLLTEFPADPKAAGAYLKLGKVHEGRGEEDKARAIWQELPAKFPDAANEVVLARDYLQKL